MPRPTRGFRTASKECYEKFCTQNPDVTLSFEDYKKILYTYNSNLITHLLETGDVMKFPYGLGELVVNKYKPKKYKKYKDGNEKINMAVDWVETKKAGKYIYLLNAHTDGFRFYWLWSHLKARIKAAQIWRFNLARIHSRMLKTYLKKPGGKYKDIYKQFPRIR